MIQGIFNTQLNSAGGPGATTNSCHFAYFTGSSVTGGMLYLAPAGNDSTWLSPVVFPNSGDISNGSTYGPATCTIHTNSSSAQAQGSDGNIFTLTLDITFLGSVLLPPNTPPANYYMFDYYMFFFAEDNAGIESNGSMWSYWGFWLP
jgi:hypothetical protein